MIKVEKIDVWGIDHAIRGMRNPMNSWDKSDSRYATALDEATIANVKKGEFILGENDLDLMRRLYNAGSEHRKYLRQIFVSFDITAPLYWWKEFDTYKVGTTANSCSTMHKIHSKNLTLEDFSTEHLTKFSKDALKKYIGVIDMYCDEYNNSKQKKDWWQIIQLLPSSYNQKRTITMNYENVITMIKQRTGHKLNEWNAFVAILKNLPYISEIMA